MKIVFWSNVHGQTATTSNLIIIALFAVIEYNIKSLITQSHFNLNNLESSLIGTSNTESKEIFEDIGLDAIARNIKSNSLDKESFDNCSLSYLNERLHLLPGTTKNNKGIYELDMLETFKIMLNEATSFYDIVFIDANSGVNQVSNGLLEEADLIIANLCQNKFVLNDFFNNHSNKFKDKTLYLIGNYSFESYYSLRNISKLYKVKKNKIATIPHNVQFLDAQSNGEVIKFLLRNVDCSKEDKNYRFIKESRNAAQMVLIERMIRC